MEKIKKILPFIYFFVLVAIILGPILYSKGMFFLLDYIPHDIGINIDTYLNGGRTFNEIPIRFLFSLSYKVLGANIAERLFFSGSLFLAGLCLFYSLPKKMGLFPRLAAGTFYIINPFVYERFMSGHIFVLLGYAMLPICFMYFQKIFYTKELKGIDIFMSALFWTLTIMCSAHFLVITGILFAIAALTKFCCELPKMNKKNISRHLLSIIKVVFYLIILNLFWIIPSLFYHPALIESFDINHFYAFKTASDPKFGSFINVLGMYGFWREATTNEIMLAKNYLPFWPSFLIPFFLLIIIGWKKIFKTNTSLAYTTIVLFLIVMFLTAPYDFVYNVFLTIPGFSGMREPEKISSILLLIYAIMAGYGLDYLQKRWSKYWGNITILLFFIWVIVFSYKFLWGANNQIKTFSYPLSYLKMHEISQYKKNVLVLPWKMYARYQFGNGRTIIDPTRIFFESDVLATSDIGIDIIDKEQNYSGKEELIRKILKINDSQIWSESLEKIGMEYVFVNKINDDPKQKFDDTFLRKSNQFELIYEDDLATIFQIKR